MEPRGGKTSQGVLGPERGSKVCRDILPAAPLLGPNELSVLLRPHGMEVLGGVGVVGAHQSCLQDMEWSWWWLYGMN